MSSSKLINNALDALRLLEDASKGGQIDNLDFIIETLDSLIQDYELALTQLEQNHINH